MQRNVAYPQPRNWATLASIAHERLARFQTFFKCCFQTSSQGVRGLARNSATNGPHVEIRYSIRSGPQNRRHDHHCCESGETRPNGQVSRQVSRVMSGASAFPESNFQLRVCTLGYACGLNLLGNQMRATSPHPNRRWSRCKGDRRWRGP